MVRWLPQAFREVHAKTWHLSWSIAWENIGTVPAKHCNPWVHFSYGGFHTTVFMILRFSCFIWKEIYVTAYYTSSRCLSSSKREVEWKYRKNMCCSTGGLVCTYLWLCLLVCSKFCFWRWCPSLQDRFWYLLRPPLHLLLLKLLLLAALLNQCPGLIFPNKFSNMPCQISTPVSALLLVRHICWNISNSTIRER